MPAIPMRTVVEAPGGVRGVVIRDEFCVCDTDETLVAWEGVLGNLGFPTEKLKVIGPENAIADLKKCGAGQGEKCCIFLTVGPRGASCERFGHLHTSIIFRKDKMNAQREPREMYPNCQLQSH